MPRRVTKFGNPIYDNCGTYQGFQRHRRYNTLACKPCVEARNRWMQDYRRDTGQTTSTLMPVDMKIAVKLVCVRHQGQCQDPEPETVLLNPGDSARGSCDRDDVTFEVTVNLV